MLDSNLIEEIKKRLIKIYDPLEIYLFGSYAWGKPDKDSDLDLLVVVDYIQDEQQRHKSLVQGYSILYDLGFSKDILLCSKEEFEQKSKNVTTLIHTIKHEGKQIYAKA